jgi:hypothetical protein
MSLRETKTRSVAAGFRIDRRSTADRKSRFHPEDTESAEVESEKALSRAMDLLVSDG